MTSVDTFATDILNCGTSDLSLLDEVYSKLADEVLGGDWVKEEVMERQSDLNSILYTLYNTVKDAVIERMVSIYNTTDDEELASVIIENVNDLNRPPYPNCLDSKFDSDLDQTIDWESDVDSNVEYIIDYWRRS